MEVRETVSVRVEDGDSVTEGVATSDTEEVPEGLEVTKAETEGDGLIEVERVTDREGVTETCVQLYLKLDIEMDSPPSNTVPMKRKKNGPGQPGGNLSKILEKQK